MIMLFELIEIFDMQTMIRGCCWTSTIDARSDRRRQRRQCCCTVMVAHGCRAQRVTHRRCCRISHREVSYASRHSIGCWTASMLFRRTSSTSSAVWRGFEQTHRDSPTATARSSSRVAAVLVVIWQCYLH